MISAEEARKKTDEAQNKTRDKVMRRIETNILKAIVEGNDRTYFYGHLQKAEKKALEELGYKVKVRFRNGDEDCEIIWAEHDPPYLGIRKA
jgi:hypothetical protein